MEQRLAKAPGDVAALLERAGLLDRLGRRRNTTDAFGQIAREARLARDDAALMRAARKLFQWRQEMTRERL